MSRIPDTFVWINQAEMLNAIQWLNEKLRKDGHPAIHEGLDTAHPAYRLFEAATCAPVAREGK